MREVRVERAVEREGERRVVRRRVVHGAAAQAREELVDVADAADGAEVVPGAFEGTSIFIVTLEKPGNGQGGSEHAPVLVVLLHVPKVLETRKLLRGEQRAERARAPRRQRLERAEREQPVHVLVRQVRAGCGLVQALRDRGREDGEPGVLLLRPVQRVRAVVV